MKKVKWLLMYLMIMILISGCQNKQAEEITDEGKVSGEVSVEIKKESTPDTIEDDQYDWISDSERLGEEGEVIGLYDQLEFVGEYLVFYYHGGEWDDTGRPEYITVESVEEVLATGKLYNDVMFVLRY